MAINTTSPIPRKRVLVVDDSPFLCRLIASYLSTEIDLEVVELAHTGEQAIESVLKHKPDVMTLDLDMPGMNGLEVLERVMSIAPTSTVLISGVNRAAATSTLRALELGGIDFVLKYTPGVNNNPETLKAEIVQKVRQAACVKAIRTIRHHGVVTPIPCAVPVCPGQTPIHTAPVSALRQVEMRCGPLPRRTRPVNMLPPGGLVVIGASTGGPIALRELLSQLSTGFPAAIVVVQHMPAMFTRVFSEQLNQALPLDVKEAASGDTLKAGTVLVAPGDWHLEIQPDGRVNLHQGPRCDGHRPAIDVAMKSAAAAFGHHVKGVLLTGMGCDGAEGLHAIRQAGGLALAQNAESCVVYGMPMRARELGMIDGEGNPAELSYILSRIVMPTLQEAL